MPVEALTLLAFLPAALALNLTPGADMMFTLGQGLKGGWRAGQAANLGIAVGCMVHVLLAALGLAAVLKTHPAAFEAVRWAGVLYLLWLAVQSLRSGIATPKEVAKQSSLRIFREALVVNLLNPKVIFFILSFLPQFVDPSRPVLPQFLLLGLVFCAGGFVVNGIVGGFASTIGAKLAASARLSRWLGRVTAGIFTMLALRLAVMER
ncbi:LysE family translocator [Xinfangfangia sp. CPCC 101601]|uniref:LysE family translocator n=1 Tax=Pseudogemmobacter lacusdianii TaxID=3069608 RepID=A0ABU0W076_9RHOB|nr:LysE family translocator [Xinfangfangia sp. CPCC 101601]MDQ2067414.1 LysE family translocator [Xinfangfangia sp. CPCC 101601]